MGFFLERSLWKFCYSTFVGGYFLVSSSVQSVPHLSFPRGGSFGGGLTLFFPPKRRRSRGHFMTGEGQERRRRGPLAFFFLRRYSPDSLCDSTTRKGSIPGFFFFWHTRGEFNRLWRFPLLPRGPACSFLSIWNLVQWVIWALFLRARGEDGCVLNWSLFLKVFLPRGGLRGGFFPVQLRTSSPFLLSASLARRTRI